MEKTGMLVLCVCLTFMSLGCTQGQAITVGTSATVTSHTEPNGTTPLPDHTLTHVTSNSHSNVTTPSTSSTSDVSSTNTSSQQSTVSSGATQSSGATSPLGSGTNTRTASATTLKGGSASLFGSYYGLLVPVISVLIYST